MRLKFTALEDRSMLAAITGLVFFDNNAEGAGGGVAGAEHTVALATRPGGYDPANEAPEVGEEGPADEVGGIGEEDPPLTRQGLF